MNQVKGLEPCKRMMCVQNNVSCLCSKLSSDDNTFNHNTAGETATWRQLKSYDTVVRISPVYTVRRHRA